MEPVLDEASLIRSPNMPPANRIMQMADTLKALDTLGAPRVLRAVRDAADRDLADGLGLRVWCFDKHTPRDQGRLIATRLNKAPYIDGSDGLFAAAEAERAIQPRVIQPSIDGSRSLGGGHVALTDSVLVFLGGSTWPPKKPVVVRLEVLTEDDTWVEEVPIDAVDSTAEVNALAAPIMRKVDLAISNGITLVSRLSELFPRLVLGELAAEQLARMTGTEVFYPQILRHLRALNRTAEEWTVGTSFAPNGVNFSPESEATLQHGRFGPMRDFPTPQDFTAERWTFHTKLTGGSGARIYYKTHDVDEPKQNGDPVRRLRVAVGYVGPHLATVKFR